MESNEQTPTKETSTQTAANMVNDAGNKPTSESLLERADKAGERLRLENERLEANIKELKELEARRVLGGMSEAGQPQPEQKEMSPQDYAKKALGGQI